MSDNLTHPVCVAFNKEQLDAIKKSAENKGMSVSAFIRHHAIIAAGIPTKETHDDIFVKIWGEDAAQAKAFLGKIFDLE